MMEAIESVKEALIRRGARDECMVKGCKTGDATPIELLAFDPIDHENTWLAVCDDHLEWAHERNDVASEIHAKLREQRKRIGQEHLADIKRLAEPERETSEAILMGEYDTLEEARRAGE